MSRTVSVKPSEIGGDSVRALGVARVSTREQASDEHFSFAAQRLRIQQYCTEHAWELTDIFEYVRSGGSNRRELDYILDRVRAEDIDVVVVNELDRLARDMVSTLLFLEELKVAGARFVSVADGLDLTTPEGELHMHILAMFAQYFRRQLSRKVKAGQAQRAQAGKRHGERPYGYRPAGDTWVIDAEEAAIVRHVYHWYLDENWGFRAIAKQLNHDDIPGQRGQTGTWDARTVERMLRRHAYAGDTIYGKWIQTRDRDGHTHQMRQEPSIVPDTHPAIINRETWNATQARLARKAQLGHVGRGSPHVFSGLVRCGECGTSMVALPLGRRGKDHTRAPVYVCRAYHVKGTCSRATAIPVATLEGLVLDGLTGILRDAGSPPTLEMLAQWVGDNPALQERQARQRRIRQRIDEIPRMVANAETAMLQGVYAPAEFARVRDRLATEHGRLDRELAVLDAEPLPIDAQTVAEHVSRILADLETALTDPTIHEGLRAALQGIVLGITCWPGERVRVRYVGGSTD